MTINIYSVDYYQQKSTKCVFKSTKTMGKRQTAVEWLIKEFELEKYNLDATLDFARSIEKQQIMHAHHMGAVNYQGGEDNFNHFQDNDHYYNENYGKK